MRKKVSLLHSDKLQDLMVEGETHVEVHGLTCKDFIFCEDCQEFVDLFNQSLNDAGHGKCHWRYVVLRELRECVRDCEEDYIPYCPKCDAIVDYEMAHGKPCSCGERLHEETAVWRNFFEEER